MLLGSNVWFEYVIRDGFILGLLIGSEDWFKYEIEDATVLVLLFIYEDGIKDVFILGLWCYLDLMIGLNIYFKMGYYLDCWLNLNMELNMDLVPPKDMEITSIMVHLM